MRFFFTAKIEKARRITSQLPATCLTAPKSIAGDYAMGYTTGHVRLIDIKKSTRTKSFNPDVMNNSVNFLDFNCTDEYLGVVYENGTACTFNTKTNVIGEKLKVDRDAMMLRYHRTKPHLMGIVSLPAVLTVWDSVNRKKAIYRDAEAHKAPITDICWDIEHPDLLYTTGYDLMVKVFDFRKRTCAAQIKGQHPYNCFTVSDCGKYIATANLNCIVDTYDIRNTKQIVATNNLKQKDYDRIVRLAIVPGK